MAPSCREKGKKGEETRGKSAPCQHHKIGGKMKRKKTKRKQQGCDVAKLIDTVEKAVSTAKVYRAIEPVVNALTKRDADVEMIALVQHRITKPRSQFGPGLNAPKKSLSSCSVFRQTASMEAEIDCKLQSNSS
jgi:ethanolamine utilization protein EutP (predicted NTPase)